MRDANASGADTEGTNPPIDDTRQTEGPQHDAAGASEARPVANEPATLPGEDDAGEAGLEFVSLIGPSRASTTSATHASRDESRSTAAAPPSPPAIRADAAQSHPGESVAPDGGQGGDLCMAMPLEAMGSKLDDEANAELQARQATSPVAAAPRTLQASAHAGNDLLHGLASPVSVDGPAAPSVTAGMALPTSAPDADSGHDALTANAARIARALHSAVNQNGGAVTIRLTPPELGFVRVQVELRDGAASVQFQSDQEAARGLLSNQLGALRGALERQGLTVARLEVQPLTPPTGFAESRLHSPTDDGRSRGGFADDHAQRQPQRHAAPERDESDAAFSNVLINTVG